MSLTNEEYFRYHGTLPESEIIRLLDLEQKTDSVCSIDAWVKETKSCFPSEDALSGVIVKLNALKRKLRGNNRDELNEIIESLEEVQSDINQNVEYGMEQIGFIEKELNQIKNI